MAEDNILKNMGERIYHRRKQLKLTQEELAEKMSVSTQMISNLELGKKAIRPENLVKLCEVLGVSADYILMGTGSLLPLEEILKKISFLSPQEFKMINELIDYMNLNKK